MIAPHTLAAQTNPTRDLIGQSLMLRIDGDTATEATRALLAGTRAGGIVLFAANIRDPQQLHALCAGIQQQAAELNLPPLLIAIDQEGGVVSRLPAPFVVPPSQQALGESGDPTLARAAARLTGEQLRAHGVNMNFAPVLDVGNNPNNPVIGTRAFSANPQQVADFALAALQGYAETGVIATLKHFPGHGDTTIDSHLGLPTASHTRARLNAVELAPFRAAITAGAPAIMTAHMLFTALDELPVTLSPAILQGLLRAEPASGGLGFNGLIVSDALDMRAIADRYGAPQAAILAKRAGVDLLIPMGTDAEQIAVANALQTALERGELDPALFAATVERLQHLRAHYNLHADTPLPPPISAEQTQQGIAITRRTLQLTDPNRALPLPPDSELLVIDCLQPRFSNVEEAVARADLLRELVRQTLPNSHYHTLLPDDPPEHWTRLADAALTAPATLVITRNAVFVQQQQRLLADLMEASTTLIHLAARSPHDAKLTPNATHIRTFGDQPLGMHCAMQQLTERSAEAHVST